MASEYRLTGRLEGGELAELYRAEKIGGGPVVVKLFHARTTDAAYARDLAETQNRLLKVGHPSVLQILDIGIVENRLAVVRPDPVGFTLGQALQRLNTREVVITASLAMSIVIELLEALNEAHVAAVIHGALTPGNVLLPTAGRPSICDFGALAALNAVPGLRKNFADRGRSSYRAPEVGKGEGLSIQSDVYSLGAMMYELLTLKEPSTGPSHMSTRRDQLPPPSRLDRRLSSRIDPIVLRALDPVAGRRYRGAGEFATALREFLTQSGGFPARDELARTMVQLFPPEVVSLYAPTLELPFEKPFSLEPVGGAHLDEVDEVSVMVSERKSFSGGTLEIPAVEVALPLDPTVRRAVKEPEGVDHHDAPTRTDIPRPDEWHAPPAPMPPVTSRSGPKDSIHPDVLKRVKRIEDFEPRNDDTLRVPRRLETTDELPNVFPGRPPEPSPPRREKEKEKKPDDYASIPSDVPLPLSDDVVVDGGKRRRLFTEERNIKQIERSHTKWIPIVAGSAALALLVLFIGMWRFDVQPDLPVYVPPPRVAKKPQPLAPPPKVEHLQAKPPANETCYVPPKKESGFLSVSATDPIDVRVDGDFVCGSKAKIPLMPGTRRVVVVDTRTGEEYVSPTRIEVGKLTRLIPIFKGR